MNDPVAHIKAFLTLGFKLANVLVALKDGFQLKDLGAIVDAAKSVPGGLAAATAALAEYVDMKDEAAAPLEAWVIENFDIPNDSVEAAIESGINIVIECHSLVAMLKPKS